MRCPFCSADEKDKVIETRVSKDGGEIRRRRECEACSRRFTTYERIEESMPVVIKADGRREPFDRNKIEHGIHAAVAKRAVSRDQVSALAEDVEREIGELEAARHVLAIDLALGASHPVLSAGGGCTCLSVCSCGSSCGPLSARSASSSFSKPSRSRKSR